MAGAPLGAIENTELLEHLEPCPKAWLKSRKTGGFYVFRTLPTCKTTTWQKMERWTLKGTLHSLGVLVDPLLKVDINC
jgi:hypothetical protein